MTAHSSDDKLVSGGEALVLALLAEGVDVVFGYPGGAIMPTYDAIYPYLDRLRHILVRHEQGAIHAAQGYARASGKIGVCLATSGPGATNLVTGIADALLDSTPVLCITGQVASHLLGSDAFQETDVCSVTLPITKWNHQVVRADDIAAAVAKACAIARSGRPGPVLLDVTKDAQVQKTRFSYAPYVPRARVQMAAEPVLADVERAVHLINHAERPLVIAGQGVLLSGADRELREFVEITGAPVACTLLGLSAIPTRHPQYVGMVGMHGSVGANRCTNECDVLVAIGMRFDDRVTGDLKRYARQAKVIHLDIDASEINKNVRAEVALVGDAKVSLQAMLGRLKHREHPTWLKAFRDCDKLEYDKVIRQDLSPTGRGLRMGEVVRMVSELAGDTAICVSDVGQHQMAAARYSVFREPRCHITSGGLGTMGFALPAALGAQVACNDKIVVAMVGDGGFQMTLQELGTIAQTRAPVKVVVLNNQFLGMVRQWQELFFDKRYAETELQNPDFTKVAEAYGISSHTVVTRESLRGHIQAMLSHPGPYVLNVMVEKEANVFPMVPTGASVSEVQLEARP